MGEHGAAALQDANPQPADCSALGIIQVCWPSGLVKLWIQYSADMTRHLETCCRAGLVNLWIQDVRSIRDKHADTLRQLKGTEPVDKLVELNVVRQVR